MKQFGVYFPAVNELGLDCPLDIEIRRKEANEMRGIRLERSMAENEREIHEKISSLR